MVDKGGNLGSTLPVWINYICVFGQHCIY